MTPDLSEPARWLIQCGSNSNYYVKTCWFTRKISGQKPTTTTTKDQTQALRFDTPEAAEVMVRKINAYCTPNACHSVVPGTE